MHELWKQEFRLRAPRLVLAEIPSIVEIRKARKHRTITVTLSGVPDSKDKVRTWVNAGVVHVQGSGLAMADEIDIKPLKGGGVRINRLVIGGGSGNSTQLSILGDGRIVTGGVGLPDSVMKATPEEILKVTVNVPGGTSVLARSIRGIDCDVYLASLMLDGTGSFRGKVKAVGTLAGVLDRGATLELGRPARTRKKLLIDDKAHFSEGVN